MLNGETALGCIQLHRRDSQVQHNPVHCLPADVLHRLQQGNIGGLGQNGALPVRSQGLTCKRQRLGIKVQTQQTPVRRTGLQNSAGVTARSDCPVDVAAGISWAATRV